MVFGSFLLCYRCFVTIPFLIWECFWVIWDFLKWGFNGFCSIAEVLSRLHEKYGSVVKVWLGPTKLLVSVKEPVLIKEMLLKAEDKLPLTGRAFSLAFGQSSLFASSFDKVDSV